MIRLIKSLTLFFLLVSSVSAQTQFIKHKGFLIPITSQTYPAGCEAMSATQKNVLYIDDIGELEDDGNPNTPINTSLSPDPNGVLDLAIVLGLSDKFNLLAVGVGIPGKGIGHSRNSTRQVDIDLAQAIVTKSSVTSRTTNQAIPVYAKSDLLFEINKFANCASVSDPLIVVLAGPWFDLQYALEDNSDIADKIKLIGIGGSNTSGNVHPGPHEVNAQIFIENAISANNYTEIPRVDFVKVLTPTTGSCGTNPAYTNCNSSDLSAFYNTNLKPVLLGVKDSHNHDITSAYYTSELELLNSSVGGHRLRIADFTAIALAIDEWSYSEVFDKSVMYPVIDTALGTLPQ